MHVNIAELIQSLLAAAWRRRLLILVPLTLFIAVSALAAQLWPRDYASTMLIMLQERGSPNPLRSTADITRELRLKADEIEALLKSDRVISSALLDLRRGREPPAAADLESAIRDLKRSLVVKVVGGEFIEIEMRDTNAHGLGAKLSTVATRFLENLMSREDTLKTARHFAMEQRKRDVDQTREMLNAWNAYHAADGSANGAKIVDQAASRVAAAQARLAAARAEVEAATRATLGNALEPASIAWAVAGERARLAQAPHPAQGPPIDGRPTMAALDNLERLLRAYEAVKADHFVAQIAEQKVRGEQAGTEAQRQEKQRLEARLAQSIALYETHQKRGGISLGVSAAPLGLIAPEHIRIVDEPRDPVSPLTSALKIIVACIGAGLALGVGMAALAEQLDDRIYSADGLDKIVGVPLVARLPKLEAAGPIADDGARELVPDQSGLDARKEAERATPHASGPIPLRRSARVPAATGGG